MMQHYLTRLYQLSSAQLIPIISGYNYQFSRLFIMMPRSIILISLILFYHLITISIVVLLTLETIYYYDATRHHSYLPDTPRKAVPDYHFAPRILTLIIY